MKFPFAATITPRSTSDTRDDHGNLTVADGDAVVTVGWWQQDSEEDHRKDRDQSIVEGWLFLPAGTAIDRTDKVEIQDVTLEVSGRPRVVTTPRGNHHIEARARLAEG